MDHPTPTNSPPAAIRQLPDIALRMIFRTLVDYSHEDVDLDAIEYQEERCRRYPMLMVISTCKWWRFVACSSPSLWQNIFLNSDVGIEATRSCISTHLQRAREFPLNVLVRYTHEKQQGESWFTEMVNCFQGIELASLKIENEPYDWQNWKFELPKTQALALSGIPNLDELSLKGVKKLSLIDTFIWSPKDADSLEEISIFSGMAGLMPSFFLTCTNLRRLNLAGDSPCDDDDDFILPFKNFTTLELDLQASLHMTSFYTELMSLPSFRTLIFHLSDGDEANQHTVDDYVERFEASVYHLEIRGALKSVSHIIPSGIIHFLKVAPNPTHLALPCNNVAKLVVATLHHQAKSASPGDTVMFPALQSIHVSSDFDHGEKFVELVKFRCSLGLPRIECAPMYP